MSIKIIINSEYSYQKNIKQILQWLQEYKFLRLTISFGAGRSTDQNAKLWAMLEDISKQVEWFGSYHSPDNWKDIISGSFQQCKFVPNIENNGLIAVGLSTSGMSMERFSEMIEYIYCFGTEKGVAWSEPSKEVITQSREKTEVRRMQRV
jgi:hypothetical protein